MNSDIKKDQLKLGENLKEIREKRKMTQAEVAKIAKINVNYYARIERGGENPSLEVLRGLVAAFKVKSKEILPF